MTQSPIIIWHNKVCSTSRKALAIIEQYSNKIEIRDYIKQAPSPAEIRAVLKKMNAPAQAILRKKDKVFQELFASKTMTEAAWIVAMSQHPSIIERPIIIVQDQAFIARPIETFEEKLNALLT